jgi:hypothetical protein
VAAVIAPGRDYVLEAERRLHRLTAAHRESDAAAAADYGMALVDWLTLEDRQ